MEEVFKLKQHHNDNEGCAPVGVTICLHDQHVIIIIIIINNISTLLMKFSTNLHILREERSRGALLLCNQNHRGL